ncbi:Por secretion system C-terminal sorting domain-containing protein [Catalinimonas alkaloidigena]|uniref:Por secretion system C-terminal sorting domain-containing protein n=1 Tax=Catalinimonas alkaloidigena TaxID=1075417 RepID=A0A1G8XH02_9BACT|nr:carbohydrate-binding protein [Catalinimonas alkaloidigena]SDJ89858.1 Por secretion system C-terminal sorting domain-containing protein [Catalinimonas alkaloidigena]
MNRSFARLALLWLLGVALPPALLAQTLRTDTPVQYEKVEFDLPLTVPFTNPYLADDIRLDLVFTAPSGNRVVLPCYYESGASGNSLWKARFAPREAGTYRYQLEVRQQETLTSTSAEGTMEVAPSAEDGFVLPHDTWTFQYSSGRPFRGIGENVGWEARSWEDPKYTYDYFLPKLADHGANFIRLWMHAWNLPLEWKHVISTDRYTDSDAYFNPGAIRRMDELIHLCDSLGIYLMVALDAHGGFISSGEWPQNNYNTTNGGPVDTPAEFFTSDEAKAKYKNRLRYLVARWGYSTSIAVWEFFNEVDNAMYDGETVIIPHADVTQWHREMSAYLKDLDPYGHLVSTSISHREIEGLTAVPDFDFNMKHIYRATGSIPAALREGIDRTGKPYVIGEFSYDWDWNNIGEAIGPELDYDLKRGLWYGLFNPTPILPMTWWWEFFDERGTYTYFKGVRQISDRMLATGNGTITSTNAFTTLQNLDLYAVNSGANYFVYTLNKSEDSSNTGAVNVTGVANGTYFLQRFDPETGTYASLGQVQVTNGLFQIAKVALAGHESRIYLLTTEESEAKAPYTGDASPIPGTLEAENFDRGGEGVAYHDLETTNTGGAYRPDEGVDLSTVSNGGYALTNTVYGEWLDYTVDVQMAGQYTVMLSVASAQTGGTFHLEQDGVRLTKTQSVPATGSADTWQELSIEVPLRTTGVQTLRFHVDAGGFHLDAMQFTLTNQAPTVALLAPADDATVELPDPLMLRAEASDADGSIASVAFYRNETLLGEVTEAPFVWSWTPTAGQFTLSAQATDNQGFTVASAPVQVTVLPSQIQTPYGGTPHPLPGKIEAEDFDEGIASVAYYDLSAGNRFGQYRTDTDVDLEVCTDEGGGFDLADIQAGEWVEYTVDVATAGTYAFSFRVATQESNQAFDLLVNDQLVAEAIAVPNTGAWQNWQTLTVPDVPLPAGEAVLRFQFRSQYFNLNYFEAALITALEDAPAFHTKLYPNPSSGQFTLMLTPDVQSITLLNTRGAILQTHPRPSGASLQLGQQMHPGLYFVIVQHRHHPTEVLRAVKVE